MQDSIFLYDKPAAVTSFDALRPVKECVGTRKVGHTGTLDRFATGLLVVLTGRLTRLNQLFLGLDKSYRTGIRFGSETDTLDPSGTVVRTADVPTQQALEEALPRFQGAISQVPPAYSAVHVGGERASKRARTGTAIQIPERTVTIHNIEILSYEAPLLTMEMRCSKGCYVRSVARDLAQMVGSAGYVEELRRTAVGPYSITEALTEDELTAGHGPPSVREVLERLPGVETRTQEAAAVKRMRHGGPVPKSDLDRVAAPMIALFDEGDTLVAVVERKESGGYAYRLVVPEVNASR